MDSHAEVAFVPDVQARPQSPQFAAVSRGASQPLVGSPSQSPKPALQRTMAQAPAVHAEVALVSAQARPHWPQSASVSMGVSHPLLAAPSQSP